MADNIAEILRAARRKHRYTQEEMATLAGVKRTTYANWESGVAAPPKEALNKLGPVLAETSPLSGLRPIATGKIPVYPSISAGDPSDTGEVFRSELEVPPRFCGWDYSGVIAEGDSMMPMIQPGDILIFKNSHYPRMNKIIAVRSLDGGGAIVKKLIHEGQEMRLKSLNSKYESVGFDNVEVLGILVGIQSNDGELVIGPVESGIDENYIIGQLSSRIIGNF